MSISVSVKASYIPAVTMFIQTAKTTKSRTICLTGIAVSGLVWLPVFLVISHVQDPGKYRLIYA